MSTTQDPLSTTPLDSQPDPYGCMQDPCPARPRDDHPTSSVGGQHDRAERGAARSVAEEDAQWERGGASAPRFETIGSAGSGAGVVF